ncbi:hypothetical protein [Herbidospora sp. RD11066]
MSILVATTLAEPPEPKVWTCFAIGPIGDHLAPDDSPERGIYERALEVYEQVILAACRRFAIVTVRADELPGSGEINEQVCRQIVDADIVIADLDGGNPNVMYELGIRHAIGKPTVQLGEHGRLPFDISIIRTIQFTRSPNGLIKARRALESAIQAGMDSGFELLTPARIIRRLPSQPMPTDLVLAEEEELPGFLDGVFQIETEMEAMAVDLGEITVALHSFMEVTNAARSEFERLTQEKAPNAIRLAAIVRYSKALSSPAGEMEAASIRLAERMQTTDENVRGILAFIAGRPRENRPDMTDSFLHTLIDLDQVSSESIGQFATFGTVAEEMRRMSKHLRMPIRKIIVAVEKMSFVGERISCWAESARDLI